LLPLLRMLKKTLFGVTPPARRKPFPWLPPANVIVPETLTIMVAPAGALRVSAAWFKLMFPTLTTFTPDDRVTVSAPLTLPSAGTVGVSAAKVLDSLVASVTACARNALVLLFWITVTTGGILPTVLPVLTNASVGCCRLLCPPPLCA